MAQKLIGTSRLAQRTSGSSVNDNFNELYTKTNGKGDFKTVTANYTLVPSDTNVVLLVDSSSAVTLTLPNDLPVGSNINVIQLGTGRVTLSGASGAVLINRAGQFKTAAQNASVTLLVLPYTGATAKYLILGETGA